MGVDLGQSNLIQVPLRAINRAVNTKVSMEVISYARPGPIKPVKLVTK